MTADVLEYVSTLSAKEAKEWLFEAMIASQSKVQATATDANALADAVRQQSLAASVQRPQLFTGKQEWSVWLNSLLPWLTLQAVKNDHEAISLTLSFIKQDALSYWKSTALGQKYHQALITRGNCSACLCLWALVGLLAGVLYGACRCTYGAYMVLVDPLKHHISTASSI